MGERVRGTVANTDRGWFEFLRGRPDLEEVNFWAPSPRRTFRGEPLSPYFFRLGGSVKAVVGFAFFARFERLPVWLAWEAFGPGNGVDSLADFEARLRSLRERIRYEPTEGPDEIGCTILLEPVLFPEELWVREPSDWKPRTQAYRFYDLESGEGHLLWGRCREAARELSRETYSWTDRAWRERAARYGPGQIVHPRLGQGTFRIATLEAYERSCAVTDEHSLPVLEAAHIRPYSLGGAHEVPNGILLRADLHRLFDRGYVTVTPDLRLEVSRRLREDFDNGRTYYPLHGAPVRPPRLASHRPSAELLEWHNEAVFQR